MLYHFNGETLTLPELRVRLTDVSLPMQPTAEELAPLGVTVIPESEPDTDTELAAAKAVRLETLNAEFERANASGHFASSLGFEVDATERANRDVQGLITLMAASGQGETPFCDYGNVMRTVTLDQLRILQLEIIAYGQALYARKWALRTAVETAATLDAVQAVEIEFDTLPAPVLPQGVKVA